VCRSVSNSSATRVPNAASALAWKHGYTITKIRLKRLRSSVEPELR
jgi:hypothetical protein